MTAASRLRTLFILIFAGTVINYYLQPVASGWISWGTQACLVSSTLGFAAGTVLSPERRRIPWLLLLTGQVLSMLGGGTALAYQKITGEVPYPGLPDVFELSSYLFFVAGLVLLSRRGGLSARVSVTAAAGALLAVGIAADAYSYPLVIHPNWTGATPLITNLVSAAYPSADLLLLLLIIVLTFTVLAMKYLRPGTRISVSFLLIAIGVIGALVSDSVFAYAVLHWNWDQPSAGDIGWLTWWGAWMLAFLYPGQEVSGRMWYLSRKKPEEGGGG